MASSSRYGIIAGNGKFPFLVLEAARTQGIDMVVAAIKEETFPEIADLQGQEEPEQQEIEEEPEPEEREVEHRLLDPPFYEDERDEEGRPQPQEEDELVEAQQRGRLQRDRRQHGGEPARERDVPEDVYLLVRPYHGDLLQAVVRPGRREDQVRRGPGPAR